MSIDTRLIENNEPLLLEFDIKDEEGIIPEMVRAANFLRAGGVSAQILLRTFNTKELKNREGFYEQLKRNIRAVLGRINSAGTTIQHDVAIQGYGLVQIHLFKMSE